MGSGIRIQRSIKPDRPARITAEMHIHSRRFRFSSIAFHAVQKFNMIVKAPVQIVAAVSGNSIPKASSYILF